MFAGADSIQSAKVSKYIDELNAFIFEGKQRVTVYNKEKASQIAKVWYSSIQQEVNCNNA